MIHRKPAIFFKITPVSPFGMTTVDLGEIDGVTDVPPASASRSRSSLPPAVQAPVSETSHVCHGDNSSERGSSLPPSKKTVTIVSPSPSFEASGSETDGEEDNTASTVRVSCPLLISTSIILTEFGITDQDRDSAGSSSTDATSQMEDICKGSRLCSPKVSCRA